MQKKRADGNIYVLPMFVDNLKDALGLKTDTSFRDTYVTLLVDRIKTSAEELLTLLQGCICRDSSDKCSSLKLKSAISGKKMLIVFYDELRRDIQKVKESKRKISQETYNSIEERLNARVKDCHKKHEDESGGGTERRTISSFLNCEVEPSENSRSALRFVMTQLYPALLSQQTGTEIDKYYPIERLEAQFFKGVLESRDSIVSKLLSYDGNEIDDKNLIDDVVASLMKGKGNYESLRIERKTLREEEKRKKKIEKYTIMLDDVRKHLEGAWIVKCRIEQSKVVSNLEAAEDDEANDHYGIASLFTRCILSGLLGMDEKTVNQKMNQIGKKVYCLAVTAENQSEVLCLSNGEKTETTSLDTMEKLAMEKLFITEFLLLFFSDREIRDVMNAMPSKLCDCSEDVDSE